MKKKKKPLACINGVKGAISLIMAVLMTPFLTVAMLLVESGRYNSAVSLLDEALGISATSVLADYDPYLQNRWGLLATKQDADLTEDLKGFLNVNTASLGKSYSLKNTEAEGLLPLSETGVLKYQLLEYSKLNGPTKLASELVSTVTSMSDFVKTIKDKVEVFQKVTKTLTSGVKILDSGIDLVKKTEALKASAEALDALAEEYLDDYATFKTKVNDLIDQLAERDRRYNSWQTAKTELQGLESELQALKNKDTEYQKIIDGVKNEKGEYVVAPRALTEAEQTARDELAEDIEKKQEEVNTKKQDVNSKKTSYDNKVAEIPGYRTSANTAKSDYVDVLGRVSAELTNFKELAGGVQKAVSDLGSSLLNGASSVASMLGTLKEKRAELDEIKKNVDQAEKDLQAMIDDGVSATDPSYVAGLEMKIALEGKRDAVELEVCQLETDAAIFEAADSSLGEMADGLSTSFESYSETTIGELASAFTTLQGKVQGLNINSLTASSSKVTATAYRYLTVAGYIAADEIQKYIDEQEKKVKEGTFKAILDGLVTLYNSIMGVSIFFEDDLDAVIDLGYFEEEMGGLPGGTDTTGDVISLVTSLGNVLKDAVNINMHMNTLRFLKLLEDLKSLVEDLIALVTAIWEFVKTILMNIAELFGYERWLLCTYCTYNLTCRSDFNTASGKMSLTTMTGYSVDEESFPESKNSLEIPVFGEIYALINTILTCMADTGEDRTFSGAELEYVLFGSTSEVANQLYVFCVLYIIRALMCAPMITGNAEVQALAAASTLGYPVIMGLYYVLEPLVETALLANGKEQPLIPKTIYLSPTGLPKLITELVSFCKFTTAQQKDLKEKMIKGFAGSQENYDYNAKLYEYTNSSEYKAKKSFNFSYKDFCLVLLMITVRQERMVERLCNIIQMETMCYYERQGVEEIFDLRKSFTYLRASTEADIIQIMPDLLESELFTAKREQYRGY